MANPRSTIAREYTAQIDKPLSIQIRLLQCRVLLLKPKTRTYHNKSDMIFEFYVQDPFSILPLSKNMPGRPHTAKESLPD